MNRRLISPSFETCLFCIRSAFDNIKHKKQRMVGGCGLLIRQMAGRMVGLSGWVVAWLCGLLGGWSVGWEIGWLGGQLDG